MLCFKLSVILYSFYYISVTVFEFSRCVLWPLVQTLCICNSGSIGTAESVGQHNNDRNDVERQCGDNSLHGFVDILVSFVVSMFVVWNKQATCLLLVSI